MLYGETIAVYSEIHTKHINKPELYYSLIPYRAVNTPQQVLKIDHLMLYGERIAVYSKIHKITYLKLNHITGSDRTAHKVLSIYVSLHLVVVSGTPTFS
jgi:hypothetical protein